MDDSGLTGASLQEAFSQMSQADQREIAQMIQGESQKAQIQSSIHDLSDLCWKKCVAPNRISGGKLASGEEGCMKNCVDRFMDTTSTVLSHLEKLRSSQ